MHSTLWYTCLFVGSKVHYEPADFEFESLNKTLALWGMSLSVRLIILCDNT